MAGVSPLWRVTVTYVVYFTAVGASWPYLPVYYRGLGLDLGTIGVLAALAAALQLVAAPIWGALTDRFSGSRLTLPAASAVASAGALALFGARDLPAVAASASLLAIGLAGMGPLLDARALETLGTDRIRYGQIRAWGSLAFVVAASAVGLLIDAQGRRALFLVYVPALILTAAVSLTLRRSSTFRTASVLRGTWGLVRAPGMGLFLLGTLLVWTALTAANAFYSIQVVALGGPAYAVGLSWAVGAFVEVPIMWGFPRLARRFGTERLLVVGAWCFAVRAVAAATATDPVTLVAIAPLEGTAFALFFVGGVGHLANRAPAGLAATAQGVFTAVAGLATIIGSSLGGLVVDGLTIRGLFAACAAASGLAAIVVWFAVRSPRPSPGPVETASRPRPVPEEGRSAGGGGFERLG